MKWIINNNRHNIPIDSFILCIRLLVRASVLKEMNVCVPHEVTRIIIQWNWLSFRFGSHYQFFIIFFYCFLPLPIFFPCWIFFFFCSLRRMFATNFNLRSCSVFCVLFFRKGVACQRNWKPMWLSAKCYCNNYFLKKEEKSTFRWLLT